MEKILADANAPKRARVIGKGAFYRSASAIAACFIFAVALSFMLRSEPSEFYINVGGESLRRAGESVAVGDMPTMFGRQAELPMGIPFVIEATEAVTVTVENGELWTVKGDEGEKCEIPYIACEGETLYLVPDAAIGTKLTLTACGESVTYAVTDGERSADIRIVFEK